MDKQLFRVIYEPEAIDVEADNVQDAIRLANQTAGRKTDHIILVEAVVPALKVVPRFEWGMTKVAPHN